MSIPTADFRRQPNEPPSAVVMIPDDLIPEILSFLSVKALLRLKCVSKVWNTLISDPTFVKMHLNRSSRNPHLSLFSWEYDFENNKPRDVVFNPFPVQSLLDNSSIGFDDDHCFRLQYNKDCHKVVGSCNGLICLLGHSSTNFWLCFWNPAKRTLSEKLGYFPDLVRGGFESKLVKSLQRFTFGYDNSTDTYKVVAFRSGKKKMRIFSLGDDIWRDICFPVRPIEFHWKRCGVNDGVYLRGSLNWLAILNTDRPFLHESMTVEQFVILSLDLATEKYKQLRLPQGFSKVPHVEPTVCLLMDCLCFSHLERTNFVIWRMTEFGVEESWTQFLKISYRCIPSILHRLCHLLPLCLSHKDDTLILLDDMKSQVILYNWRDNRVEQTKYINKRKWWLFGKDYVESLVSTH